MFDRQQLTKEIGNSISGQETANSYCSECSENISCCLIANSCTRTRTRQQATADKEQQLSHRQYYVGGAKQEQLLSYTQLLTQRTADHYKKTLCPYQFSALCERSLRVEKGNFLFYNFTFSHFSSCITFFLGAVCSEYFSFCHISICICICHFIFDTVLFMYVVLKGLSHQILRGLFWPAWIRSVKVEKHLLVFKFLCYSLIFCGHFQVLKCLIPKHLGDSWNLRDRFTYVVSGFLRFSISFLENCW